MDEFSAEKLDADKKVLEEFLDAYEATDRSKVTQMAVQVLPIAEAYDGVGIQPRRSFMVYGLLGQTYGALGDYPNQLEMAKKCLSAAKRTNAADVEGRACGSLGNAYYSAGMFEEAVQMHERCLELSMQAEDIVGQCGAYGNLGSAYNSLGQVEKAIEMHQKSLALSVQSDDLAGQGKAYGSLGNAFYSKGKFREAIEMHNKDLSIAVQMNDIQGQAMALGNLANCFTSIGKFEQAIKLYEQRIDIAKTIGDLGSLVQGRCNLASLYTLIGRHSNAIELFENGLEIATQIKDVASQGTAYNGLGNAYLALGHFAKAVEFHERGLKMAQGTGSLAAQLGAWGNLGNDYKSMGQYGRAIEMHEKCLAIARQVGDVSAQGMACGNLGILYRSIGQYGRAIEMHKHDLAISAETGDSSGQAAACNNLGNIYQSLGRFEEALDLFERGLLLDEATGDAASQCRSLGSLGVAHCSLGRAARAIELQGKCLSLAEQLGNKVEQCKALGNLGNVYRSVGDFERAQQFFEKELVLAEEMADPALALLANHHLGITSMALSQPVLSVRRFEEALRCCELLQHHLFDRDDERISLFDAQRNSYLKFQRVLHDLDRHKDALAIAERGKARALDHLMWKSLHGSFSHSDPGNTVTWDNISQMVKQEGVALLEYSVLDCDTLLIWLVSPCGNLEACRLVDVRQHIVDFNSLPVLLEHTLRSVDVRRKGTISSVSWNGTLDETLDKTVEGAETQSVQATTQTDEERESHELSRKLSAWVHRFAKSTMLTSAAVQAFFSEVSPDEEMLYRAYAMIEQHDGVCKWLRSLEAMGLGPDVPTDSLREALTGVAAQVVGWQDLSELTDESLESDCKVTSASVRQLILDKVRQLFDADDVLRKLYTMLIQPVQDELKSHDNILIVPSMDLFVVPWAALINAEGKALIETHTIRLAPSLSVARQTARTSLPGQAQKPAVVGNPFPLAHRGFSSLQYASEEARMVADQLKVAPVTGREASMARVVSLLQDCTWAHLACHGWLERQALVLVAEEGDDGLLSVPDVQGGVRFAPGSTVVLSACHSGRGENSGEGVVGLSRSFLAAGAGAVVMSLWSIHDKSTMLLMQPFYCALGLGYSVPDSLRFAMVMMLRHGGRYAAPVSWAGFVVSGGTTALLQHRRGCSAASDGDGPRPARDAADDTPAVGVPWQRWSEDDVAEWLVAEGAGPLADPFRENVVDGPTLCDWSPLGERGMLRMLRVDLGVEDEGLGRAFCAAYARLTSAEAGAGPRSLRFNLAAMEEGWRQLCGWLVMPPS